VLCEILGCEPGELVRRVDVAAPVTKEPASSRAIAEDLKPAPARLRRPNRA
jgi:hypothetical protein